ncbi:RNA methyltransferase, TrmH family [Candidatus Nitrotoga sp. HW29]|uniref:TrmH family RNA methyltransferase n=1 Tax=Candidatus Nitrotoga sp. HW29 TaxID=2886963 RepID=UPI001EF2499D|nr:RNA methyltransferase [Candidatus Nitrotoga sp. HW29]CAH1905923.1 RNA methyltransferase, TrmH family [Candidatus Nitrotoga sp. HW29]
MKYISSHSNPFFKELLKLTSSARQRRKTQQTLLEGAHLLQAYHASGNQQPRHLLVTEAAAQNREVAELLKKFPDVPLSQLDDSLFAELSELKTPSCILALIELPRITITSVQSSFCLLLEDIQDPGNLGSILRSAAAAGCDAVFLSKNCADAWSPKVLRAGMGGHFVLSIHESIDLRVMATTFQGEVFAAVVDAKSNLYDCDLRGDIAFAVGNEGAGLSECLLAVINRHIAIPMSGHSESLNVAAATAVCLFEAVRQRR